MNCRIRFMDDPQSIVDSFAEFFQSVFVSSLSFYFSKCVSINNAPQISPPSLSENYVFKSL